MTSLGGVDTSGLSSKTFESRSVLELYFIGEVVDLTGHLGGFNFHLVIGLCGGPSRPGLEHDDVRA